MIATRANADASPMHAPGSDAGDPGHDFEAIYRDQRDLVRAALRQLYVDPADLDDVTQEVFVVLYRHMVAGEQPRALRAWLVQVARRVSSNHRRARARHERKRHLPWRERPVIEPDDAVARTEAGQFVTEFLDGLDEAACRAFVLAEVEGLRGREVAERLGVEVTEAYAQVRAVRRRFDRAVRRKREAEGQRWFSLAPLGFGFGTRGESGRRVGLGVKLASLAAAALTLVLALRFGGGCEGEREPQLAQPAPTETARARDEGPTRSVALAGAPIPLGGEPGPYDASYSGTIVDPEHEPVAGAIVCADRLMVPDHPLIAPPRCATSDASGRFVIEGLLDEAHTVTVMATGFLPGRAHTLPSAHLTLTLEPGGVALRGRVEDIYGGPISGAWVALVDPSEPSLGALAWTSDEGEFELWTAPGRTVVVAGADGYATVHEGALPPGAPLRIGLSAESTVSGVVIDPTTGQGVAEVRVSALLLPGPDRARIPQPVTWTRDDGTFTLSGLHPTRYILGASGPESWGHPPRPIDIGIGEHVSNVTIELVAGVAIAGRISDVDTREPCREGFATTFDVTQSSTREGRVDGEGRVLIDGVSARDEYEVTVSCRGYQTKTFLVRTADELELQDWPLPRGSVVRGRIVDSRGQPVPNFDVRLFRSRVPGPFDHRPDFVSSDADGAFEFLGVAPGDYRVAAHGHGQPFFVGVDVDVEAGADVEGLELKLDEGGAVTGVAHNHDRTPVAGALVNVQLEPLEPHPIFGFTPSQLAAMEAGGPFEATTDERGRFEIPGVRAGSYGVWVTTGSRAVGFRAALDNRAQTTPPLTTVEVTAGRETQVSLELVGGTATLAGRVLDDEDDVIADALVIARANPSAGVAQRVDEVRTGLDGSFELVGLSEGVSYTLTSYRKGGGVVHETVEPPRADLELRFRPRARVSGSVHDPGGEAPDGFRISWRPTGEGAERGWAPLSGTRGAFELELSAGTYTLSAESPVGQASTTIVLTPDQHLENVVLALSVRTKVSGRLVDSGGVPLPGRVVAVLDDEGPRTIEKLLGHAITDARGTFVVEGLPDEARTVHILAGTESTPEAFAAAAELRRFELTPKSTTSLGDVVMIPAR